MATRTILVVGAILGGLAVATGAFGAHALSDLPQKDQDSFATGAEYQMYHALALLLTGILAQLGYRAALASWCFLLGTLMFSGSLYLLVLTDTRWLVAITPIGGTLMIIGWLALAFSTWRGPAAAS